jgi:hypothetical protein
VYLGNLTADSPPISFNEKEEGGFDLMLLSIALRSFSVETRNLPSAPMVKRKILHDIHEDDNEHSAKSSLRRPSTVAIDIDQSPIKQEAKEIEIEQEENPPSTRKRKSF